jgi:hypothetical protein
MGFGDATFGGDAVEQPTPFRRWVFFDPIMNETWTVPLNPNQMTSPWPARKFAYRTTTAGRGGANVIYEGRADLAQWQFSGILLDKTHYDELLYWSQKANSVHVTDHLGRTFKVLFDQFDAKPKAAYGKPWKHDYTMTCAVFPPVGNPMGF